MLSSQTVGYSIWQTIRHKQGIIRPPVGMSEFYWAKMLFAHNGYQCEQCGTRGVRTLEFGIRRRACRWCRKKQWALQLSNLFLCFTDSEYSLVFSPDFEDRFPEYEPELMRYTVSTHAGPGVRTSHARNSKSRFYWDKDVHDTYVMYSSLMKDICMRVPNAKNALKHWKKERCELVKAVEDTYEEYRDWYDEYEQKLAAEKRERKVDRQQA